MENEVHGALVSGSSVLQTKRHDYALEQPHKAGEAECHFVEVLFSHENLVVAGVTIQEANHFVPWSIVNQDIGHWHRVFVFGVALFKFLKSTHTLIFPVLCFSTGTVLDTHSA
jgi:hypothetical protein